MPKTERKNSLGTLKGQREERNVTREKNLVNMHEPRVKVKGEHVQKYPRPRVLSLSGSRFRPDRESVAVTREKNLVNTYEETRKASEEDAKQNETDLDEKTQKALEEMVSSCSSCRPEVASSGPSCRPEVVSSGASCRPDVVSSGSSKVKPENPKEVESVAEKVVDKIETIEENNERITNEKFS